MLILSAFIAAIAYFEIKDYRQARRFRRLQAAFSQMARRVDRLKSSMDTVAIIPERVASLGEAVSKTQADIAQVLARSEFLVKEYETVIHYRKQIVDTARADFYEG